MNPNLAHFKKVKEDDHVAILKHPSGHEIRIAKKALSPKLRSQLQGLPMHLDQGGEIPYQALEAQQALRDSPDAPYTMNLANQPGILSQNDQPGLAQQVQPSSDVPVPSSTPVASSPDNPNYPIGSSPAGSAPSQASPQAKEGAPPQAQQQEGIPFPSGQDYQNAFKEGQQGIMGEAKAQGQQGKAEVIAEKAHQKAIADLQTNFEKQASAIQANSQATLKDLQDGHINPNHFYENMSVPGKISTAIGLILGGIGGGLTGQGNPALQFLEAQMNRDIEAQKANLGKKENLLSAYLKQYGNLQDATNMARVTLADNYSTQIKQAGSQTMDAAAQARAQQLDSHFLMTQKFPAMQQLAMRQALLGSGAPGGGSQQPTQMVDGRPVQPQSQVDPAIQARFLAPDEPTRSKAMAEIQNQQNINSANQNAMDAFDKVAKLQTISGRIDHLGQAQKQIDAAWDPMMDKMVKSNEGRVTPITVDLMSSLKPKLTDTDYTTALKRKQMLSLMSAERSTPTLDSLGVKVPKSAGQAKPNQGVMPGYKRASSN